jgi:hypothetical protein
MAVLIKIFAKSFDPRYLRATLTAQDMSTDAISKHTELMALTFEGGRFEDHVAPVEVLAELLTMEKLLFETARHLFLERNPDRKQVPRGFRDAARLLLTSTAHNCFTARVAVATQGDDFVVMEQARARIFAALESVGENEPAAIRSLPTVALDLLASLGRRLHQDEALQLASRSSRPVTINRHVRERLARHIHRPVEWEEGVDGEVIELKDSEHKIVVQINANRIEVQFKEVDRPIVIEALSARPVTRLRLHGLIQHTPGSNRITMKRVDDIGLFEHERSQEIKTMWERLRLLESVPDGWLNEDSLAPTAAARASARSTLARFLADYVELPKPQIYPGTDGGMLIEWIFGRWAVSFAFDAEGATSDISAIHADTGAEVVEPLGERNLNRDSAAGLAAFFKTLEARDVQ